MLTFGLVVYYEDPDPRKEVTFHLSQRRDSLAYIHFLRGKVPPEKLNRYFPLMTADEKKRLQLYCFDELWRDLYSNSHTLRDSYYTHAYTRFQELKRSGDLDRAIKESEGQSINLEWSFPKGRKKRPTEPDLVCALREYREETHSKCYLEIIDHPPIAVKQQLGALESITYYYLARSKFQPRPKFYTLDTPNIRRKSVSEETGDLAWMTYETARKILPDRMLPVLKEASQIIKGDNKKNDRFIVLQDAIAKYGNIQDGMGLSRTEEKSEENPSRQGTIESDPTGDGMSEILQLALEFEEYDGFNNPVDSIGDIADSLESVISEEEFDERGNTPDEEIRLADPVEADE